MNGLTLPGVEAAADSLQVVVDQVHDYTHHAHALYEQGEALAAKLRELLEGLERNEFGQVRL